MNTIFTDIQLTTFTLRKRIRVRPIEGQNVPTLYVSCSRLLRSQLPLGTIFKADVKLIQSGNKKPYLIALKRDYKQLRLF
ncbi:MAG: hypothetical protein MUF58_22770 [Arcicella sp.]|jgi:hypothetical protein|nr:hypothetical protein [Arcicella sp.]